MNQIRSQIKVIKMFKYYSLKMKYKYPTISVSKLVFCADIPVNSGVGLLD